MCCFPLIAGPHCSTSVRHFYHQLQEKQQTPHAGTAALCLVVFYFIFLFLMIGKYFSLVNLNRFKTQGLPINLSSPTLSPSPRLCRSLDTYLCFASCPQCQREVGPGGGTPVQPSAGTTQLCSDTEELPCACSPGWEHDGPCTTTWV